MLSKEQKSLEESLNNLLADVNFNKKDLQRLEKNLTNMKNNLKKIESKLDNKSFIEKAPSEIIQSNFNKQKYFKKEIDSLQDLIECLSD